MAVFESENPKSWIIHVSLLFLSLSCIEQSVMVVNWNIIYQCETYEENFSKYVDISRVMYWWNHRAELIETILHSLLFDSGKLTAKIWTGLGINIFSVLFFGLYHADTVIKKKSLSSQNIECIQQVSFGGWKTFPCIIAKDFIIGRDRICPIFMNPLHICLRMWNFLFGVIFLLNLFYGVFLHLMLWWNSFVLSSIAALSSPCRILDLRVFYSFSYCNHLLLTDWIVGLIG